MIHQEVVDEILGRFKTAWDTTSHEAIYPDVPLTPFQTALIDGKGESLLEPWARLTIRTAKRDQRSFGSGNGDGRKWDTVGVLMVEIYTPTGDGLTQAYALGEIVKNAFEGVYTSNSVWYSDGNYTESGSEGLWSRITFTVKWEAHDYR